MYLSTVHITLHLLHPNPLAAQGCRQAAARTRRATPAIAVAEDLHLDTDGRAATAATQASVCVECEVWSLCVCVTLPRSTDGLVWFVTPRTCSELLRKKSVLESLTLLDSGPSSTKNAGACNTELRYYYQVLGLSAVRYSKGY